MKVLRLLLALPLFVVVYALVSVLMAITWPTARVGVWLSGRGAALARWVTHA